MDTRQRNPPGTILQKEDFTNGCTYDLNPPLGKGDELRRFNETDFHGRIKKYYGNKFSNPSNT
jgi:hypothetical protein